MLYTFMKKLFAGNMEVNPNNLTEINTISIQNDENIAIELFWLITEALVALT